MSTPSLREHLAERARAVLAENFLDGTALAEVDRVTLTDAIVAYQELIPDLIIGLEIPEVTS